MSKNLVQKLGFFLVYRLKHFGMSFPFLFFQFFTRADLTSRQKTHR